MEPRSLCFWLSVLSSSSAAKTALLLVFWSLDGASVASHAPEDQNDYTFINKVFSRVFSRNKHTLQQSRIEQQWTKTVSKSRPLLFHNPSALSSLTKSNFACRNSTNTRCITPRPIVTPKFLVIHSYYTIHTVDTLNVPPFWCKPAYTHTHYLLHTNNPLHNTTFAIHNYTSYTCVNSQIVRTHSQERVDAWMHSCAYTHWSLWEGQREIWAIICDTLCVPPERERSFLINSNTKRSQNNWKWKLRKS